MGGERAHRLACGRVLELAGQLSRDGQGACRETDRPKVLLMAVARRGMPLALRLGRARRRALNRRALTRRFGAASTALVEGWSGPPEPAVAAGPSLAAPASIEPAPVPPAPLPVATLPRGDVPPADEGEPAGRLRRCTFRRLDPTGPALGRDGTTYTVVCLYGGTAEPESLGDLASAAAACRACTNTGIFRPDEA